MEATSVLSRSKTGLNEIGPVLVGLAIVTWLITSFRTLGGVDADYGGFVTVSERLLAGDRLYANVYENKDPLFHYLFASSRLISPLGSWFLGIGWMIFGAVAVWLVMRSLGVSKRAAFFTACIAVPVVMTGASYFPGASHIPGIVFTFIALAAALRNSFFLAGLAVAAVVGVKLIMAPLALALVVLTIVYNRSQKSVLRTCFGLVVGLGFLTLVLILRGELTPYLDNLRLNTVYSQAAAGDREGLAAFRNHLDRVMEFSNTVTLLTLVFLFFTSVAFMPAWRKWTRRDAFLVLATVGATTYSLIVLTITGLWGHHGLILIVPALLSLVTLFVVTPKILAAVPDRSLPLLLFVTWLLAGAIAPVAYVQSLEYARSNIQSHVTQGDESLAISSSGSPTTYMRVGNARDAGHAYGLREWKLACPRIFQEVWESSELLQPTLDCLPHANVILISKEVAPITGFPDWSRYVRQVEALVAANYDCREVDAGRVCIRNED